MKEELKMATEPKDPGKQDAPAATDFRKKKLDRKNLLIYPEIMKPKFDDYLD